MSLLHIWSANTCLWVQVCSKVCTMNLDYMQGYQSIVYHAHAFSDVNFSCECWSVFVEEEKTVPGKTYQFIQVRGAAYVVA